MNFISLFAGIGGFDEAFRRAGMTCVGMCEIDPSAQSVLKRHFPDVPLYDDVRKVGKKTHERRTVDLVCGGFPCQDLSVAGKRAGLAGERSGLWFEFARIIDELEPGWVVIENVPGLLSSNEGKDFAVILRWLVERGYGVAWRVLDSQYFGVPQRRRRVFIVASFGNGRAAEVLFEREGGTGNPPTRGQTGKDTARTFGEDSEGSSQPVNEAYLLSTVDDGRADRRDGGLYVNKVDVGNGISSKSDLLIAATLNSGGNNGGFRTEPGEHLVAFQQNTRDEVRLMGGHGAIAGALAAQPGMKQQNYLAFDANQNGMDVTEDIAPTMRHGGDGDNHRSSHPRLTVMAHGQGGAEIDEDKSPSLTANHEQPILFEQKGFGHSGGETIKFNDVANTVNGQTGSETTAMIQGVWEMTHADEVIRENGDTAPTLQQRMGTGGNQVPMVGIRRLTPVECERLQGFPDGWTDGQADSTRYRQLGNAVTVNVLEWIGKRIMNTI